MATRAGFLGKIRALKEKCSKSVIVDRCNQIVLDRADLYCDQRGANQKQPVNKARREHGRNTPPGHMLQIVAGPSTRQRSRRSTG